MLLFSPPAVCFGLVLVGISIARSEVHPRVPGVIMAASGSALLLVEHDPDGRVGEPHHVGRV